MHRGSQGVKCFLFGLAGFLLGVPSCSGADSDCAATRTCPPPIRYIEAGGFADWWDAGAAGQDTAGSWGGDAGASMGADAGASMGGDAGAAGARGESGRDPGAAGAAGFSGEGGTSAIESFSSKDDALAILSVSPADAASGVESDAEIVVHFSRPMDSAAVQAGYGSVDLPAAALTFDWNAARTILTLKPKAPLSYETGEASGGEPGFLPKTYRFAFDRPARDSNGEPLASAHFSFNTLRQVSQQISADTPRTSNWTDGEGEGIDNCRRAATPPYSPSVCVGDDAQNVRYAGLLSFDLRELPEHIRHFSNARLLATGVIYGAPDTLGTSLLEHLTFAEPSEAALAAPADANLGPFYTGVGLASGSHFQLSADLTSALAQDYDNRNAPAMSSQYRLSFAQISANSAWDDVEFSTSAIRLWVIYLMP